MGVFHAGEGKGNNQIILIHGAIFYIDQNRPYLVYLKVMVGKMLKKHCTLSVTLLFSIVPECQHDAIEDN